MQQLASHGLFNVMVEAEGDTWIDDHHTNEDIGGPAPCLSCLSIYLLPLLPLGCKSMFAGSFQQLTCKLWALAGPWQACLS